MKTIWSGGTSFWREERVKPILAQTLESHQSHLILGPNLEPCVLLPWVLIDQRLDGVILVPISALPKRDGRGYPVCGAGFGRSMDERWQTFQFVTYDLLSFREGRKAWIQGHCDRNRIKNSRVPYLYPILTFKTHSVLDVQLAAAKL